MPMIGWVFLDVGNILLDEDPLTYFVFRRHVEAIRRVRPERSFAELLAEREARASAGSTWPVFDVISSYLDHVASAEVWASTEREVRGQFAALSPPVIGAAALVERLAGRYRLGLIANQGREARDHLAALGLLGRFDIVAFSEQEGLAKPDPALFERALARAGARPDECLMVGDRIDNDLAPAAGLGMATCWVRWPHRAAKGWQPPDADAAAYLESLRRSASQAAARWIHVRPSAVVDEISEVDGAIAALP